MNGDLSFGDALAQIFSFMGELAFKFIPGTLATLIGTNTTGTGPIPSGLSPITEPVTASSIVDFLERTSSPEQFASFTHNWSVFVAVSMLLSLLLSTGMIYCFIRIRQVRHQERLKFQAAEHTVVAHDLPRTQLRWNRIIDQASSSSEQNWRLSILEADIMLNELLDMEGYKGETMADKMKQVDRAVFNTIDQAWEAHKIRNQIAHEGANYHLDEREVRRVIALYGRVFREFKLIQ